MNAINMIAIVLMIGGILGLTYGSFNYTRETQEASIEQSVKETVPVRIPIWTNIGAIVLGSSGGLLLLLNKKIM